MAFGAFHGRAAAKRMGIIGRLVGQICWKMARSGKLGYPRVGEGDQNWALRGDALTRGGIDDRDLIREKQSGTKTDRTEPRRVLNLLWKGDQLD